MSNILSADDNLRSTTNHKKITGAKRKLVDGAFDELISDNTIPNYANKTATSTSLVPSVDEVVVLRKEDDDEDNNDNDNNNNNNNNNNDCDDDDDNASYNARTVNALLSVFPSSEQKKNRKTRTATSRKKIRNLLAKDDNAPVLRTVEEVNRLGVNRERYNATLENMPLPKKTKIREYGKFTYHSKFARMVTATERGVRIPAEVLLSRDPSEVKGPYRRLRNFVLDLNLTIDELIHYQFVAYTDLQCTSETRRRRRDDDTEMCAFVNCERKSSTRHLCKKHYSKYTKIHKAMLTSKPWWQY